MPEPYVLDIELPEASQRDLREILQALGLSGERSEDLGEAIGAALSTEAFLLREAAGQGGKVLIVDKNGKQRELLLRARGAITDGGRPDRR
jgi:hypothetical protein